MVRIIHLEWLESAVGEDFNHLCKNYILELEPEQLQENFSDDHSDSQPFMTRSDEWVSPKGTTGMNALVPTYSSTYGLEWRFVHRVIAEYKHWCNAWSTKLKT